MDKSILMPPRAMLMFSHFDVIAIGTFFISARFTSNTTPDIMYKINPNTAIELACNIWNIVEQNDVLIYLIFNYLVNEWMLIQFTHQYLIFVSCRNRNQLYDGHCEKKYHWDDARISDDSGIKPDLAARIDT